MNSLKVFMVISAKTLNEIYSSTIESFISYMSSSVESAAIPCVISLILFKDSIL